MNNYNCVNRKEFAEQLSKDIFARPSSVYFFQGKQGSGKEYVVDIVEDNLHSKCIAYRIVSDAMLKRNQFISTHKFNVEFSLNGFIGLSLSAEKNDATKINYIVSNLKSITPKKNVLISITNYDVLPAESRDFTNLLLNNKYLIEQKIKKSITIIITDQCDYFSTLCEYKKVYFHDYSRNDIYNYLVSSCNFSSKKINSKVLNTIQKLCGTNFDLVKCYAKYLIDKEGDISFDSIVDTKLNYYIKSGNIQNLSEKQLRDILYISSISEYTLTPEVISYINQTDINTIDVGFKCAVDEYFLNKESSSYISAYDNYYFISEKEKNYIYNKATEIYSNKKIMYYIYISNVFEDEYFERALFLYKIYNTINEEVFTMIGLAISKSFLLNDKMTFNKINNFMECCSEPKYNILYSNIVKAYTSHYSSNYEETSNILKNIEYTDINIVLGAELRRLEFKNGNLGHLLSSQQLNGLVCTLNTYIEKGIKLEVGFTNDVKEEKLLSLRIVFDIAPYILDTQNNKDLFLSLYDTSLVIVNYINKNFIKKSFSEYIINIFNRKAFLFAPPTSALLYYEQAEAYFKKNNILDEYIITLASKAGNSIALHRYSSAVNECKKAIKCIEDNNMNVPQIQKIYNNMYIALFLEYEANNKALAKLRKKAKETINNLKELLTDESCARNHVILTNISSLYLYINSEQNYLKTKEKLEKSLNCSDVSDVKDVKVNDFYRYHFAWYEFYRHLIHQDWSSAEKTINNLTNFYPAIFHNYEKMNLRVEAARTLISKKYIPSVLDFCSNFLQYAPSDKKIYTSRGLLLSDLQFTSIE